APPRPNFFFLLIFFILIFFILIILVLVFLLPAADGFSARSRHFFLLFLLVLIIFVATPNSFFAHTRSFFFLVFLFFGGRRWFATDAGFLFGSRWGRLTAGSGR